MDLANNIYLMVSPLVKGELKVPFGKVLFGRQWMDWEDAAICREVENNNINIIWNLREYSHGNIGESNEIWSPIEDHGVPKNLTSFLKDTENIISCIKDGKTVFVHCYGGKGRTSLALAALLMGLGSSKEEAVEQVKTLAGGPETEEQENFLLTLDFPKTVM